MRNFCNSDTYHRYLMCMWWTLVSTTIYSSWNWNLAQRVILESKICMAVHVKKGSWNVFFARAFTHAVPHMANASRNLLDLVSCLLLILQWLGYKTLESLVPYLEGAHWHTLCLICIRSFAFLWCKMPMFWRAGMREKGKPLPLAFQYLIFMV